jgi:hypothetical protein
MCSTHNYLPINLPTYLPMCTNFLHPNFYQKIIRLFQQTLFEQLEFGYVIHLFSEVRGQRKRHLIWGCRIRVWCSRKRDEKLSLCLPYSSLLLLCLSLSSLSLCVCLFFLSLARSRRRICAREAENFQGRHGTCY